jgi:hypothetical protein
MGSSGNLRSSGTKEAETVLEKQFIVTESPHFNKRLKRFVQGAQRIIDDHFRKENYHWEPERLSVEKWPRTNRVRVVATYRENRSVWCFINFKTGDVLTAAGWKRPAKHPTGNIFDDSNGLRRVDENGPHYLKH